MKYRRRGLANVKWVRWAWVGLTVALLLTLAMVVYAAPRHTSSTPDPSLSVAFSHKTHADKGIDCLYCHSNASRGEVASIPSVEKCMGCHQVVTPADPQSRAEVEKIRNAWANGEPLRWPRMVDQPDFVYFSHGPHIRAGVQCEDCHGDVGSVDMPDQDFHMTMGFCLDCHQQQDPAKVDKLMDCATCHK